MSTQSLLAQVELLYAEGFDTWSPFSALCRRFFIRIAEAALTLTETKYYDINGGDHARCTPEYCTDGGVDPNKLDDSQTLLSLRS